MHVLEVGGPYPSRLPESVQYNYRAGQHELLMVLGGLSGREVQDIRRGTCEFALYVEGPVIDLLYRFGQAIPWSDAPYSWHLAPVRERTLPELEPTLETRAVLSVVLVEARTDIVRALRAGRLRQSQVCGVPAER